MPIAYEQVMPWGRAYAEYIRMFHLEQADLGRRILGCADGPAEFNAGMYNRGRSMVSVDPIYRFSRDQLSDRIRDTYDIVLEQTRKHRHLFRWSSIPNVETLGQLRMAAMQEFLDDYAAGLEQNRYIAAELPSLPFANSSFDLVLCSHFLFLYSDHLDLGFHLRAIEEMLRIGNEVRIFPIVDMNAEKSAHLKPVTDHFAKLGTTQQVTVDYEFQIGANQMLVVHKTHRFQGPCPEVGAPKT